MAKMGIGVTKTGMGVAKIGMSVTKMGMSVVKTGMTVAEMGVRVAKMGMRDAKMSVGVATTRVVWLSKGCVPDRRRRIIPEVVLVRRWAVGVLGIGWNKGGQFTSNLRPRWTDPVTARRVPSK